MSEVRYPDYRQYDAMRNTVNTSIMALLAGSRLANNTLALTDGSSRTLGEIFPAVEHIKRFNLRTDVAREFLSSADTHLATMAITYVLAVHEDFVMSTITLVRSQGITVSAPNRRGIKAWNMHSTLFAALNYQPTTQWVEAFHTLRLMRNSVIHAGARAQPDLISHLAQVSTSGTQLWHRLNHQAPSAIVQNGVVTLVAQHIFCALAVIKELGREINAALQAAISTRNWAEICVHDYQNATTKMKNSRSWRRSLLGYANFFYGPVALTNAELENAARNAGFWTITPWELAN